MSTWINIFVPIIQIVVAIAIGYWQIRVARQLASPISKRQIALSKKQIGSKYKKKPSLKIYFLNEPFWFAIGYMLASILNGLNARKMVNSSEPLTRLAVFYICFYTLATAYWGFFGIQWVKAYVGYIQKQKHT